MGRYTLGKDQPVKICTRCKTEHPATYFYKGMYECKDCSRERHKKWRADNRERHNELCRNWHRADPIRSRTHELKKKFGITHDDYLKMLKDQGGKCLICGNESAGDRAHFSVDHNHNTGKIRGLLCTKCNRGLGCFNDSLVLMRKAVRYLEEKDG